MLTVLIIGVYFLFEVAYIVNARKPSLYEILNVTRETQAKEIKGKRREASLIYHPDKLKGSDKELYADVFVNLNYLFDSVTKERDNYDFLGIQVDAETKHDGTKEQEADKRFYSSLNSIPFYILWSFIPISYLEKEKRFAKILCFALVAAFGALEISFIS